MLGSATYRSVIFMLVVLLLTSTYAIPNADRFREMASQLWSHTKNKDQRQSDVVPQSDIRDHNRTASFSKISVFLTDYDVYHSLCLSRDFLLSTTALRSFATAPGTDLDNYNCLTAMDDGNIY